jgi:AcrR family transcriptional regulator
VPELSNRDRRAQETRLRITEVALDLFVERGYAETTIDQIAEAAGVGRRTVFRYFATKESILFDHLAIRREVVLDRLRLRPAGEPPLVSLHAVLREHCRTSFDGRLLDQIRAVLASDPRLGRDEVPLGTLAFEEQVIATLSERAGDASTPVEIRALTHMASSWVLTAVQVHLIEGRDSLERTFDDVVAACVRATAVELG